MEIGFDYVWEKLSITYKSRRDGGVLNIAAMHISNKDVQMDITWSLAITSHHIGTWCSFKWQFVDKNLFFGELLYLTLAVGFWKKFKKFKIIYFKKLDRLKLLDEKFDCPCFIWFFFFLKVDS